MSKDPTELPTLPIQPAETPNTQQSSSLQTTKSQVEPNDSTQELTAQLKELTVESKQKEGEDVTDEPKDDSHHEQQQEFFTRDLIDISKTSINFNKNMLFPGSIDEVEVVIGLRDEVLPDEDPKAAYLLRVIAVCHNSEFNELDEYVLSVRSNERFEYFEEVRFRIRKKERAQVRVAVKIPVVKEGTVIQGTLSVQLENTVPIFLQIYAKCQMPKIVCLKELFEVAEQTHLIKIPAKKNMRIPPIPFKNISAFNFIMEVETATTEDFSQRAYDIISQNTVNCMANSPFFVNLQLKANPKAATPKTDTIRKILILKVKNSSVFYSYPIEAYVYESSNTGSMS